MWVMRKVGWRWAKAREHPAAAGMGDGGQVAVEDVGDQPGIENVGGPAEGDGAPALDRQQPVGMQRGQVEIVQDGDDAAAARAKSRAISITSNWCLMSRLAIGSSSSRKRGWPSSTGCHTWQRTRANCARCCSPPERVW